MAVLLSLSFPFATAASVAGRSNLATVASGRFLLLPHGCVSFGYLINASDGCWQKRKPRAVSVCGVARRWGRRLQSASSSSLSFSLFGVGVRSKPFFPNLKPKPSRDFFRMSEQRSVNADRSTTGTNRNSNEEMAEVRSALRDLACLVNQAFSAQAVGHRGTTSSAAGEQHHAQDRGRRVLRDFLDQRVPEFAGLPDPMIAEDWLSRMEKAFEVIRCDPADMVRLAIHRLVGEADHWWKMLKRELHVSVDELSWEEFQRHFNNKYFPSCVRTRKEAEFLSLRQGSMTVAQYEAQFIALSRFAPYLVDTDERKARRFQDGLNDVIQMQLLPFDLEEYGAVLKRAMIIEQALIRRGQIQQSASTPIGFRPQHSSFKKRPNFKGQGGGKRCFKCQKTGHLAQNCNASSSAPSRPSSFSPAPTSREHQSTRTCYNCGKPGHFIKDCKAPKQGVPGSAGQQRPQRSGRVYAVTEQQARDSPDVVQEQMRSSQSFLLG